MELDVAILARVQFALTAGFHFLFPPITIGMGVVMVITEGTYLWTKNPVYEQMTKFLVKIFAVVFAVGVASGLVLEFQFGTNWATYSRYVGDVFGSALAAEGIFAFFLESGFLALLIFGWDRVKPKVHFFATVMVALGSIFSAVWIIVANSFMQTPAGFMIDGQGLTARAEITDFWGLVFNPSSMDRLIHTLIASVLTGAFFILSIMAYYIIRGRHLDMAKRAFSIALGVAAIGAFAQFVSGHSSGEIVAEYQPAKLAAMEGHWGPPADVAQEADRDPEIHSGIPGPQREASEPAALYLFGWVDKESGETRGPKIPGFVSFLTHYDSDVPMKGLNDFPKDERPPANLTFQSYHLMITLGVGIFVLCLLGVIFYLWKRRIYKMKWLLWLFVFGVFMPLVAAQAGWTAAEVGRQPWIVYPSTDMNGEDQPGLRTSEALSATVESEAVLGSIIMFTLIYGSLFVVWVYVMNRKIKQGPDEMVMHPEQPPKKGKPLFEALRQRVDPSGESMTTAREEDATEQESPKKETKE